MSTYLDIRWYCINSYIISILHGNINEISTNVCNLFAFLCKTDYSRKSSRCRVEFVNERKLIRWSTSKIFHRINRQLGPLSGHGSATMGHRFKPIESNYGIPTCLIRLSKRLEWFIIRLCQTIWRSFVVSGECRSPKSSRETQLIFTRVVIKDLACEFFARRAKSGNHFDSLNLVRSRVIGETGWSRFFECHWLSRIVIEWNFIDIPRMSKWY